MRLIAAFLQLIRLPNLLFIALTQALFQFCIYYPLYNGNIPAHDTRDFILLVFASLFIGAAGYIINDYFDINIDEVNKPEKMIVDKVISRRWAIAWHFIFSITGILLTIFALPLFEKWYLILGNILCILLLWFYSTTFKRKLLIGNIAISILTAWTILLIFFSKVSISDAFDPDHSGQPKFFRFAFLYAGFAFIISLIREAIKDIEDMPGDARYGCKTMPIVWGVQASKVFAAVWLVVLIGAIAIVQFYVLHSGWWWSALYSLLLLVGPLLWLLNQLYKAQNSKDFNAISKAIKLIMLVGILSMLVIQFYL